MRWLFALMFLGCGRIGFDAVEDVTPTFPRCEPAAAELCNAFDDDCDLQIDEGCPCTDFVDGFTTSYGAGPVPAWTGAGYGIAWNDPLELKAKFTFIDAVTKPNTVEIPASIGTAANPIYIAGLQWTGDRFVLAIQDVVESTPRLRVAMVRRDGSIDGVPTVIASPAYDPRQLAFPDHAAVLYSTQADNRSVAMLGDGGTVTRTIALAVAPGRWYARAAAGDGELAILGLTDYLTGTGQLSLARFDAASGALIGPPINVGSASTLADHYAIVWIGTGYALVWLERAATAPFDRLWFAQLAGGVLTTPVMIEGGDLIGYPDLAWSGSGFVVAWQTYVAAAARVHLAIARLTTTGTRAVVPDRVIPGEGGERYPGVRIAPAFGRAGIAYVEASESVGFVRFTQRCD